MPVRAERTAMVLRLAGTIDILIAVALVATPFLSARIGRPLTFVIGFVIAAGAVAMFVIANRVVRQGRSTAPY